MERSLPRRRLRPAPGPLGPASVLAAERRRLLGLTQQDLADLAGVSVRSVQALEAGKQSLRVDVLLRVLEALGLALVVVRPSELGRMGSRGAVVGGGKPDGTSDDG